MSCPLPHSIRDTSSRFNIVGECVNTEMHSKYAGARNTMEDQRHYLYLHLASCEVEMFKWTDRICGVASMLIFI
jgi:hypothetical protein